HLERVIRSRDAIGPSVINHLRIEHLTISNIFIFDTVSMKVLNFLDVPSKNHRSVGVLHTGSIRLPQMIFHSISERYFPAVISRIEINPGKIRLGLET